MQKLNDRVTTSRWPLFCDDEWFKRCTEILLTDLGSDDSLSNDHSPSLLLA